MADGGSYHYQHDPYRDSPSSQRTPVSPLLPAQRLPLLRTSERDANDLSQLVSPIMSRSPSITSDSRYSALSGGTGTFPANPANVRPPAAYVAPFGAAQVVSDHQASRASGFSSDDDDDLKPSKDDVSFSPSALALINAFLDQLLFSFLSAAKTTNLNALRLAVTDILRHKLARDAIASANEELSDLLAGGDDEDEKDDKYDGGQKWDLELVWRRTRLRVMVYTRIGDMEDEDEERHVKEQELFANGERGRFSSTAGLVSWSAAIFLTSVLEYVAEQSLQAAGTAAFSRKRKEHTADERLNGAESVAVVINDQDVERIALNPALGRLWRSWRKTMRANVRPTTPSARVDTAVVSPTTNKSLSSPRDSFGTAPESAHDGDEDAQDEAELPDTRYPEHILASNIRLPMGDPLRDIDEIEVPGLARDPDEISPEGDVTPVASKPDRRRSFSNYQSRQAEQLALSSATLSEDDDAAPKLQRRRSNSVPAPYRNAAEVFEEPSAAEVEEKSRLEDKPGSGTDATATPTNTTEPAKQEIQPADAQAFNFTIDEIDKRKSLIDIKTLLGAVSGGYAADIVKKDITPDDRPSSAGSDQSFSLGNKDASTIPQQPIAEPQHMEGIEENPQIGVATTSDQAVAPERAPSAAGTKSPSPLPPDGVSRASSTARSRYTPSPIESPRQAQKEDTAVVTPAIGAATVVAVGAAAAAAATATATVETSEASAAAPARDRPIETNEQTLAALRESVQRASSPQAAQQDSQAQSSNRKSVIAQYATPVSAYNSQAQSDQAVEHPSLQHRKSLNEGRKNHARLTSASIRGPEDFDQFVQSDEVVKYTLTPEPVRDAPDSNAQSLAQLTGQVPLVVQPTANNGTKTGTALSDAQRKSHRFSVTRPPTRNSSINRRSGFMPREARVLTESTRDFADFIRSTKPDKEPQIQPLVTSQSSNSLRNSTNYSMPRTSSLSGDRTRSLTRSDIAAGHAPPVPILPGQSKPQAKSARANSQQNGELISFIRDGPKDNTQNRRSGAPSRTTMDSEQLDSLKNSSARPSSDARPATTRATSATSSQPSLRASMAGRPPYMNGLSMNGISNADSVAHPAYSNQQPFGTITAEQGPEDMQRKRYRNKDPYALDSDDEEDISALPKGKRGEQTSKEALRGSEAKDGDKPIASASSLAQAREIMERARANTAKSVGRNSFYGSSPEDKDGDVTALPTSNAKSNMEARAPTAARAADRLGLRGTSDTKDLADFLRDSGPPTAPAPSIGRGVQGQKSAQQKENVVKEEKKSRGFFSFFKRSSSKGKPRHSDMP